MARTEALLTAVSWIACIVTANHLFLGGPAPLAPLAACGPDPAPDQLTCESFPPCA